MAQSTFIVYDRNNFNCETYDLNDPIQVGRFQNNVKSFMDLVRATFHGSNTEIDAANSQMVEEFCKFVDDKEVWNLASMVVPEFRTSLSEQ